MHLQQGLNMLISKPSREIFGNFNPLYFTGLCRRPPNAIISSTDPFDCRLIFHQTTPLSRARDRHEALERLLEWGGKLLLVTRKALGSERI
jgi:hypothetical protein